MHRVEHIADVRRHVNPWRSRGPIGLVPTMGALHPGHESLIDRARRECARVVVSVFVNPLQFDRRDDLDRYPRPLDADTATCSRLGVDLLFAPGPDEMYREAPACTVDPGPLGTFLCGAHRPGHFRGVATVVLKLFNIVTPDRAYFGEKDAQQLAIIRRMVRDFDLPLSIVGVPTVRESDGVALSSRNARLSPSERQLAPALYHALRAADAAIAGGATDATAIKRIASAALDDQQDIRLEYFELVDPVTMQPVARVGGPVLAAGAIWLGQTRLIDNLLSRPPDTP